MFLGTGTPLVYVEIRQSYQKPRFWPKWPKILTFWEKSKIYDLNMTGVYLYVFWDNKLIGIW